MSAYLGVSSMVPRQTQGSRAFTVLEVLIALAIIGMLAAIVMIPMTGHMRGAELDGATARVQNALSDAQAEARESGVPVTVVAVIREDGRTGLNSRAVPAPSSESAAPVPGMEHAFARATRTVDLPQGVTIGGIERASQPSRSIGGMAMPASESSIGQASSGERTLAVFLPDGSAVVAGPIRVQGKDGRASDVLVNPWTGIAALASVKRGEDHDHESSARDRGAGGLVDEADPFAKWR